MRTSLPAYWASWGDCLHMVHQRHPDVARVLVDHLEGGADTPYLSAVVACTRELEGVQGFHPPSWTALAFGARPPPPQEDFELDALKGGWQHEASSRVERQFRGRNVLPVLTDGERALLRSQSGSGAGVAFSTVPCNPLVRIEPQLFRVLLLRRLRLPLPLLGVFAGVAVYSTPLAITAHHAPELGFLGGEAMPSRVRQQGCVERQVRASRRMFWFVIWTWGLQRRQVLEGWRSWPTACHCLAGPSWPSTQRWCQLCIATGVPAQVPHTGTEWRWKWQDVARNGLTRN